MAEGIRHEFVNPQDDGIDTDVTRPSDWNADHLGGVELSPDTEQVIEAQDPDITPVIVRGAAGQTADIWRAEANDHTGFLYVDADGLVKGEYHRNSAIFHPKDFGDIGGTNDIVALQAAMDAARDAGGGLVVTEILHNVKDSLVMYSNCGLVGVGWNSGLRGIASGWTGASTAEGGHILLINENYDALAYTDESITIQNLCLDFGTITADGAGHAVRFQWVRHIRVNNVLFLCNSNGDAFAGLHVDDVVIDGCSAYDFTNCAWDFWRNPTNVVISNNYAESGVSLNQFINFNPDEETTCDGVTVIGNTCVNTDTDAHAIQIEPLLVGAVKNVIFSGNRLYNISLFMRGDVQNAVVSGNVWYGIDTLPAILAVAGVGGNPKGITISGNTVKNPTVDAGTWDGIFQVEATTAVIFGNVCVDSDGAVPFIDNGAIAAALLGNNSNTEIITNQLVNPLAVAGALFPGQEGFGLQTTGGFWHATGVPSNANGSNNHWCISDNGHLYFKTGGAWVQKV